MKRLIPLGLTIFFLAILIGLAPHRTAVSAPEAASISPQNTISTTISNTLYLPCVANHACASGISSPFSIQIAGLYEFRPPTGMTKAEIDQLRAQEYAELTAVFPTLVEALRQSGAGSARVYIDWSYIQPDSPTDHNWTMYDGWISQAASAGVELIGTVSNPPVWAIDETANPCSNVIVPGARQDFYNFLTEVVNRYKPYGIHTWEVLNEPDAIDGYRCTSGTSNYGWHGAEYANVLSGAYAAIKAVDPNAKVIMGGLAYDWFYLDTADPNGDGSPDGKFNRYFIDDVVSSGGGNFADAVNFHYFHDHAAEWERWTVGNLPTCGYYTMRDPDQPTYPSYGKDLVAKGSHFVNRLKTCFGVDKPLWVTEVGFHGMTNPPEGSESTLDNQARYVFMIHARGLAVGAENITWYALKIIPSITKDDYQGLLYDSRDGVLDNEPKPAFYAYQTLTRELDGYKYASTPTAPTGVEAFTFSNPCQPAKTIAWYNGSGSVEYNLGAARQVRLVYRPDASGNDHIVTFNDGDPNDLDGAVNGQVTIGLDLEPVIIQVNP